MFVYCIVCILYVYMLQEIEMESHFCSVSLDIIGKSIFNYDFGSVTNESPVIKVRNSILVNVIALQCAAHGLQVYT
jgi:hypothetical protein